jgi:hypothetical protein
MRTSAPITVAAALVLAASCSSPSNTGQLSSGVCAASCPKTCGADPDCDLSKGEMCCDLGSDGKACLPATQCPRLCDDDQQCDTPKGEACLRVSLASPSSLCVRPVAALRLCGGDSQCDTGKGEVCCTIYKEPVCLPAGSCPRACSASGECDAARNEICCTTLAQKDRTLAGEGLCVDPSKVPCPTPCATSSDCSSAKGEVCCNGLCNTSCTQSCAQSSDCRGQVCCKTRAALSSLLGDGVKPGFARSGCTSSAQCTGKNHKCVGGACTPVCEEVLGCLQTTCVSGCDPNKVCDMLACPAARALAQCIAFKCTSCFASGFGSYECQSCIDAPGSCAVERRACTAYGCKGNDPAPPPVDVSSPDTSDSTVCQTACAKLASCGSVYEDAICSSSAISSCPSAVWSTMQCLQGLSCSELTDPVKIQGCSGKP